MQNKGEYFLPESLIVYKPRFPGRIGEWLMSLFPPLGFWGTIFARCIVGEERDEIATKISKIDLSPYLDKKDSKEGKRE